VSLTVLSLNRRLCSECVHGYLGAQGVFCVEYQEPVHDERGAAADCPSYEGDEPIATTNGTPPPQRPEVTHVVEVVAKVASENGGKGVWVASTAEDLKDLTDMCEAYLAKRHCVLWGEPFEIITPKGRREAAEWLATQIAGLGFQGDQAPG
jgi:hypothetical protein